MQREIGGHLYEGVQHGIELINPLKQVDRDLNRRHAMRGERCRQLCDRVVFHYRVLFGSVAAAGTVDHGSINGTALHCSSIEPSDRSSDFGSTVVIRERVSSW